MSPMLTSQGLVLATAMAVSAGTVILFDLFRQNLFSQNAPSDGKQVLKSCLCSGSKKKKKKRVQFADDVKDTKGNGEVYRREHRKSGEIRKNSCGNEIQKPPANHAALYSGILRDRVQRIESY